MVVMENKKVVVLIQGGVGVEKSQVILLPIEIIAIQTICTSGLVFRFPLVGLFIFSCY